jgi:hypothetical protein
MSPDARAAHLPRISTSAVLRSAGRAVARNLRLGCVLAGAEIVCRDMTAAVL